MALADGNGEQGRHVMTENPDGRGPFVVLCDHASNRFPAACNGLGLDDVQRSGHIAWDPGALAVARRMAGRLDAPLIWPDISRLIIDCNRAYDAPDLIPETGEGQPVPGNRDLSPEERNRRIETFHRPYHRAIDDLLDRRAGSGMPSALVAVHSFTAVFFGNQRPWPIGVISDRNGNLADHVATELKAGADLNVGVNKPYSPADGVYYTLSVHGDARGLPSVMIEIRNDEITNDAECQAWADRLSHILASARLRGPPDA